jgi:hypothetical protein
MGALRSKTESSFTRASALIPVSMRSSSLSAGVRPGTIFMSAHFPADLSRDLAVYDPQLLITGVAFKVDELNLLFDAIPPLDSVLCYVGGEGLASLEVTTGDLGLLAQADGHRTVREMAERLNLSPPEVARNLARFRLAGVLELVPPPGSTPKPPKSAMAAAG